MTVSLNSRFKDQANSIEVGMVLEVRSHFRRSVFHLVMILLF